jgi:hypothetical protein
MLIMGFRSPELLAGDTHRYVAQFTGKSEGCVCVVCISESRFGIGRYETAGNQNQGQPSFGLHLHTCM